MITKFRKYISNVIFPWQNILDNSYDRLDDAENVIKEQKTVISNQTDYSLMLQDNISRVYEMVSQLAKTVVDSNLIVQAQLEKEKEQIRIERELNEEINKLRAIN